MTNLMHGRHLTALLLAASHGAVGLRAGALPRRGVLATAAASLITDMPQLELPAFAADPSAALFAQRFSIDGRISPLPPFGQYSSYEDELSTPKGSKAVLLPVRFEFPGQFQQIGRALGGIQFVDGNSGLKVRVRLERTCTP